MKRIFDDLKRRAAELGFEGEEMRQWVKQQHDVERDFRVKRKGSYKEKRNEGNGDGREKTGT